MLRFTEMERLTRLRPRATVAPTALETLRGGGLHSFLLSRLVTNAFSGFFGVLGDGVKPIGDLTPAKKLSMSASFAFLMSTLLLPAVKLPWRKGRRMRRVLTRMSALAVPAYFNQEVLTLSHMMNVPSSEAVALANTFAWNGTLIPDDSVRLTMISGSSKML